MEGKLVTVVIPVYNVEKYLNCCITSVVQQTYKNLDIILVDDGSSDKCPELCDDWTKKDTRIRVIHKKNEGAGRARNTGIEHAKGQYICFFDSDDYIEADTIQNSLNLAEKEQADIVIFGMANVDSTGKIIREYLPANEIICLHGQKIQEQLLPDLIDPKHKNAKYQNLCLSAWCCLFDMELISAVKWRFVSERQIFSEDGYSLIWLYKYIQTVVILPEIKYYYRKNEASLTMSYKIDRFDQIKKFYADTMQMAFEQGFDDKICPRIRGLFLSFTIAVLKQIVLSDLNYSEKRKNLLEIMKDQKFQKILNEQRGEYKSISRNILLWGLRKKSCILISFLVQIHQYFNKNKYLKGCKDEEKICT